MKLFAWHHQSEEDVLEILKTSKHGLSKQEVLRRQKKDGLNELPRAKRKTAWQIFFQQFASPLILVLVVASIISLFLREWLDAFVIILAVLLNVILGFVEEYKADRSLEKLISLLPLEVKVRRNGEVHIVESKEIVVGDIVLLSQGDKIVADGRVIKLQGLEVNESALTGESYAISKEKDILPHELEVPERKNMVFAGTVVTTGSAEVCITAIGNKTEIGKITAMVEGAQDGETPLQKQLSSLARILGLFAALIVVFVSLLGVLQGFHLVEMFETAVALAVAAIPEGLVVALTVILAVSMQRTLKKNALVRRLVASETLGSISVICMDKTGTLTTGKMEVVEVILEDGENIFNDHESLKVDRVLAHMNRAIVEEAEDGERILGSPTEIAFRRYLIKKNFDVIENDPVAEIPFDSSRKYHAAIYKMRDNTAEGFLIGAPDILLSKLKGRKNPQWKEIFEDMVKRGLRVLVVCQKPWEQGVELNDDTLVDMDFIGFIGLKDPVRKDVNHVVDRAREAGLRPIMITGDHQETALRIAKESGIYKKGSKIVTGADLAKLSDDELLQEIDSIDIYARVLPSQKMRIVDAFHAKGEAVAMTGDGVNDAPAIKAADIGIALGSGTEVAKETADMVLLDDNFKTILDAIKEGRVIFDNIRKVIVYLLANSTTEIFLVLGAIAFVSPLPLLPAHILWINLIADGFPSIALAFEDGEEDLMQEPPRSIKERILNKDMILLILTVGLATNIVFLAMYFGLLNNGYDIERIRTMMFFALGLGSLIYIFTLRTFRHSVFTTSPFGNKYLIYGVLIGCLLLFLPLIIPILRQIFGFVFLSPFEWVLVFGASMISFIMIEIMKIVLRFLHKNFTF